MDFFSSSFYQVSNRSIVKVETKHGIDLGIYLDKTTKMDDKEFDEILKFQAATAEEVTETNDIAPEFINGNMNNNINNNINNNGNNLHYKNESLTLKESEKTSRKKQIKIEGKFLGSETAEDLKIYKENEDKAIEALNVFKEEIRKCNLEHEMKPVGVHYFLDGNKILFDFVADHRIDFRELVKRLAARYKKRIELHQIGVRDEARMLDGLFICGQQLCCRRFLHQLNPISIKMAEVQNAPLNTMKISGYCGRLLCCLAYESEQYEKAKENMPELGTVVSWNNEKYIIAEINVIKQYLKLKKKESLEFVLLKNDSIIFNNEDPANIIILKAEIYNK